MNDNMLEMALFGELEDAPNDKMVVRVLGYKIGISDGWFHWNGLAVVFPVFKPSISFLEEKMPKSVKPEQVHLAIDFYSGDGKILVRATENPVVYQSFQLTDLLENLKSLS